MEQSPRPAWERPPAAEQRETPQQRGSRPARGSSQRWSRARAPCGKGHKRRSKGPRARRAEAGGARVHAPPGVGRRGRGRAPPRGGQRRRGLLRAQAGGGRWRGGGSDGRLHSEGATRSDLHHGAELTIDGEAASTDPSGPSKTISMTARGREAWTRQPGPSRHHDGIWTGWSKGDATGDGGDRHHAMDPMRT